MSLFKCLPLIALLYFTGAQGQSLPALQIKPVTSDCFVYVSWGWYKGQPVSANGMYVVGKDSVVLFDTPWDSTQFQPLLDTIRNRTHKPVALCIATHFHDDRTGGFAYYNQQHIRTYCTRRTNELLEKEGHATAEVIMDADSSFSVNGTLFKTYYPGPGHAPDNIVIWLPKQKILYGGCFIKSEDATSLGNLSDADPLLWRQSVRKVMLKYPNPLFIITGHDDWTNRSSLKHTDALLSKYSK